MISRLLILGCGYAGAAVARLARQRGRAVRAVVRRAEVAAGLQREGFHAVALASLDARIGNDVDPATHVVVAFPPDGITDQIIAPSLRAAAAVTYLSTTSVYSDVCGLLDDTTPLPVVVSDRARRVLAAELAFQQVGATVLRCPAIYGPDRGLHWRIWRGEHRIPGDGRRFVSRIHVDDLAALILATGKVRGETFVVGDLHPAPHEEVVRWLCSTYDLPFPPFVPLEAVPASLQADRRVDASRALRALGVTLRYGSYREGMAPAVTSIK